jgi:uncharacterized protein YaaR (DUF327 family)
VKINPLDRVTTGRYKPVMIKTGESKDFSSTLDMAKRDQRKIEEMLDKIKSAGEQLKQTKTKEDVVEYKMQIQAYLAYVLENFYRIRQDYEMGRLLIRVEIINKKIEELTAALLEQQKENFEIVGKIDEITGLLLDLYH